LIDEHGRESAHDHVDAIHDRPAGASSRSDLCSCRVLGIDRGEPGAIGHAPAEQAEGCEWHDEPFDGEEIVYPARMYEALSIVSILPLLDARSTYERKLHKPNKEEAQQLLRCHVRRQGKLVLPIFPFVPEYTSKTRRHQICTVVRLNPIPDCPDDGTNEDKEHGTVHAHDRPTKHGVPNVILNSGSGHPGNHQSADE